MPAWTIGPCRNRQIIKDNLYLRLSEDELSQCLEFQSFIDRRLGGTRLILNYLESSSSLWTSNQTISILDFSCGRGDLANKILDWSKDKPWTIQILAVDSIPEMIHTAKRIHNPNPRLTFDVGNFESPGFLQGQRFDYVVGLNSFQLYDQEKSIQFLKRVNWLSKRGFIVSDFIRDIRALFWMKSFLFWWRDDVISNLGESFIRAGFSDAEMASLVKQASLDQAVVSKHIGYRFSVSFDRALVMKPAYQPIAGLAGT